MNQKRNPNKKEMWDAHNSKLNWLCNWFPRIQKIDGVVTPQTSLVRFTRNDGMNWLENKRSLPANFTIELQQEARKLGFPLFMRTDEASAKFEWAETCYVQDESRLIRNLSLLVEENEAADLMGLNYDHLVLREYVRPDHKFTAYHGMPVGREFRFFAEDGHYECHHPYWYKEILEARMSMHKPKLPSDWETILEKQNRLTIDELHILKGLTEKVSAELTGYWSIDFLYAQDKWFLTDAALGLASHHKEDCPNRIDMELSYC